MLAEVSRETFGLWYLAVKTRWKLLEDWIFLIQTVKHTKYYNSSHVFQASRQVLHCFMSCSLPIASRQSLCCLGLCIWVHSRCPEEQGCASSRRCTVCLGRNLEELCNQPLNAKQSPAPNNSGAVSWRSWFWFSWILGPRLWWETRPCPRTLSQTTVHHLNLFENYHLQSWLFKDGIHLKNTHTHIRKGARNSRGCEEWGLSLNSSLYEHMPTWILSMDGSQPLFLDCQ